MLQLIVYIPASHLAEVKTALFAVGAGRVGDYDNCSWEVAGTGQFRPLPGSSPFIGSHGAIERVAEYRVELVLKAELKESVRAALLAAHPYEEPAYAFINISS